jgi:glycerophosphoryl diester phosphodiesterase
MRKIVRKFGIILLGVLVLLLALYGLLAIAARPLPDHPFFGQGEVLAIGHRGGRGLWPENTMFGFEQAAALDVDVLEMDIHISADGVLVTMHDDMVDRTTDGSGPIHGHTLAELVALDAGYNWTADEGETFPFRGQGIKLATLEELFERFPGRRMNIEIKQAEPPIVVPFCDMLRDFGREQDVLVGSFDAQTVKEFRRTCPGVATSMTEPEVRTFFILNTLFLGALYQAPAEAMQVPEFDDDLRVLSDRFIRSAHGHNIVVHAWTINEESDMARLLEMGVDGIISDYPDRLMDVVGR